MRLKIHDISASKIVYNKEAPKLVTVPRTGEIISFIDEKGNHHYLIKSVDWLIEQEQIIVTLKVVEY